MTAKNYRPYSRYGWGWRERRDKPGGRTWTVQKLVKEQVDFDCMPSDVDEFITELRKMRDESGLTEAKLETDYESGMYGERDHDVVKLTGWRDATQDEIDAAEKELLEREEERRRYQERQVAQLMKERPELFK